MISQVNAPASELFLILSQERVYSMDPGPHADLVFQVLHLCR